MLPHSIVSSCNQTTDHCDLWPVRWKNNGMVLKLGLGLRSAACGNGTEPDLAFFSKRWCYQIDFFFPSTRFSSPCPGSLKHLIYRSSNAVVWDGESPPHPVCLCNNSPYLPSRSTQPARSQAARGKGDHSRAPRGDAGLHNTLHRSFWLERHTSCSAGGDGAFQIPSSPRFSGTPADGWRARRMQWTLTARLLWRASSNLRTHRRGCCSRPPNGFQSGWGMKSHNEELCCHQCWRFYQKKVQL